LVYLRPKFAGPVADRIGLEVIEAAVVLLLPDFELGLCLENPDKDRRLFRHPLLGEHRACLRRERLQIGWRKLAARCQREDRSRHGSRYRGLLANRSLHTRMHLEHPAPETTEQ